MEITDLAIRRVDRLPTTGVETADARMRAAFQQKAAQVRTQGEASRRQILAEADRQAAETVAKAKEQAAAVRGVAEAQAADLGAAWPTARIPASAAFYGSMRKPTRRRWLGQTPLWCCRRTANSSSICGSVRRQSRPIDGASRVASTVKLE